jgi:integrase/recombinase XerD
MAQEGKAKALTEHEIKLIKALIKSEPHSERNMAMLMLGLKSGLRAKEIASLTTTHILNNDGTLREETTIGKGVSKGNKIATIYLNNKDLREALEEWLKVREDDISANALFYTQKRLAMRPQYIARYFYELMQRANISGASSHSLRRTFANNLMDNGTNIRDIRVFMRHSSIATTQLYFEENSTNLKAIIANL